MWVSTLVQDNYGTSQNMYTIASGRVIGGTTKFVYALVNNSGGIYRTEEEMKSDEQINLLNQGNTTKVWVKDTANINGGYPILAWQLEK